MPLNRTEVGAKNLQPRIWKQESLWGSRTQNFDRRIAIVWAPGCMDSTYIKVHVRSYRSLSSVIDDTLLFIFCMHMCLVAKSCPTLCNPMDFNPPGSSVHGIFQARILEWVVISSSRESSQPGDQTCISCTGRQILYHWAITWKAPFTFLTIIWLNFSNNPETQVLLFQVIMKKTNFKEVKSISKIKQLVHGE